MSRTGVFLDRDDTIIRDRIYLHDPDGIELLPRVCEAIRALNERNIPVIIVTNQSGIARGIFDEERLGEIHERLLGMLAACGARIDAIYYCPHHPEGTVAAYACSCTCRKPQSGMLFRAAQDFGLDLGSCYMIGDKAIDVETIHRVGGKGILLMTPGTDTADEGPDYVARDLDDAVNWILEDIVQ